ncbi:hypothetical protein ACHAWT_008268 [Skeletonema menzelii]
MSSNGRGSLSYGLNINNKKRKRGGLKGFTDGSSSSDDDSAGNAGPLSGRSAMNREISAEQAALRKRAEAAMASSSKMDSALFDYDGEYDSFASGKTESPSNKAQEREPAGKGQSRYISNLLKSAQRRSQEQEIIYERKVVKEQAEEKEFEGKEKFITSAYKKKLEEREAWAKEEEERAKREAEDDVTQKKGGSFLYGFSRNVIMGVGNGKTDEKSTNNVAKDDVLDTASGRESNHTDQQNNQRRVHSRQSENSAPARQSSGTTPNFSRNSQPTEGVGNTKDSDETKQPLTRSQILAERAVKIREARERYFKRHGLPSQ